MTLDSFNFPYKRLGEKGRSVATDSSAIQSAVC